MALADKVGTGEVVILDAATLKSGPKVRADRIDLDNVAMLEPVIEQCPPITVNYPSLTIIDGHHRQVAATRRKLTIRAVLVSLSDAEVFEQAVRANVTHGLTLTISERKSNAGRMVKDYPDWSDRRIAEACGLSNHTVSDLRPKPARSGGSAAHLNAPRREATDGKRYPADPAAQRAAVDAELKANPEAPARQVARKTGASPATVAARKQHLAAVPDVPEQAPPAVGDLMVFAPVIWKDEAACQRTNATREFARFMDHYTRWNRKPFYEQLDAARDGCPGELIEAAADMARSMAAGWERLARDLTKPSIREAQ